MNHKRTHIVIPDKLSKEIETVAGKRGQSQFFAQAAEKELQRLRQLKALKLVAGSWKDENHPELKDGAAAWVRKLRAESEKRFRKQTSR